LRGHFEAGEERGKGWKRGEKERKLKDGRKGRKTLPGINFWLRSSTC